MQKRIILSFILTSVIFLNIPFSSAQTYIPQFRLKWQVKTNIQNPKINGAYFLGFDGATYTTYNPAAPIFSANINVAVAGNISISLKNEVFEPITDPVLIGELNYLPAPINLKYAPTKINNKPVVSVNFVPIRKNPDNGRLEKLVSFDIFLTVAQNSNTDPVSYSHAKKGAKGSLLATGDWYKIGVSQTGVYKLDLNFLKNMGVSSFADLAKVKIYGKPGGMLPQLNTATRDNDLVQNAIQVVNPNGSPDGSSYILFYANGPTSWSYDPNSGHFHHQINYYSDVSYYFVTVNGDVGTTPKRIQQAQNITGPETNQITSFDAYNYHELDTITDLTSYIKSGREWYGEAFDYSISPTLRHSIQFDFPQADLTKKTFMRTSVAARSYPQPSNFGFSIDDGKTTILNSNVDGLFGGYDAFNYQYAIANNNGATTFTTPKTHFSVQARFTAGDRSQGLGWLNYIEFNVPSNLKYINGQFNFRNGSSANPDLQKYDSLEVLKSDTTIAFSFKDSISLKAGAFISFNNNPFHPIGVDTTIIAKAGDTLMIKAGGTIVHHKIKTLNRINRYHITGVPSANYQVWDVSDFHNITAMPITSSGGEATFLSYGNNLKEFVSIDGSGYFTPNAYGKIPNQDLHSLPRPDMVILAYPDFRQAADSFAAFHRLHDNFIVHIVTPDQVYNEFSSGTQDISAIRDMMKMFYGDTVPGGAKTKFMLILGAASYDYKDRVKGNTNFVPIYQGAESLTASNSFSSDDYYALVANGDGDNFDAGAGKLMYSIGRIPVYNVQQAIDVYHKTLRYLSPKNMGNWRNVACFIADDREQNLFEIQVDHDILQTYVIPQHPEMNIHKLYLDATQEVNTPAGQLFPVINKEIDENVNDGCLFMNYVGHGGQLGWAHEKVLSIADINSWHNLYNMPLIISATCQFSTFDDPSNVSAGELALFNPNGGPFALLTTTREVYINSNENLNINIMDRNILDKSGGKPKYIGDAFIYAKNKTQDANSNNFALLGDPAIRLALPENSIKVTKIERDSQPSDTFKALTLMTISGEIVSGNNILSNFNGDIFPTIFDKPEVKITLGQALGDLNDPDSPLKFSTQDNIIYKGSSTVENGKFRFQFVVPKGISSDFGKGKMSFYADNGIVDANGYSDSVIVGGSGNDTTGTHIAPVVHLFMNDTNFMAGGMVNENPSLVARVRSNLGINTLGDIGHDLTATLTKLDNASQDPNGSEYILDNYYTADKNSYQSGTITYPFSSLADGHYSLRVVVWDVANNTANATTDFVVVNSSNLTIDKIFNYPNPFRDETTFEFDHNRPNETLNVDISIYNLNGKLVRDLQSDVSSSGDRQTTIHWNGEETGGAKIASGLYVYRLTVKTMDGQVAEKSQKMLVIK